MHRERRIGYPVEYERTASAACEMRNVSDDEELTTAGTVRTAREIQAQGHTCWDGLSMSNAEARKDE